VKLKLIALIISLLLVSCTVVIVDPTENLEGEVKIHFIDVGQGDAILIQGTNGTNVLYDGGRNNTDALTYLQDLGITSLDLVIASHPDADHIGGLDVIIEAFKPKFFMDNGMVATTATYENLLLAVQEAGSSVLDATRRTINLGDAVLEIIPPPNLEAYDRNNNSIGVVLDFGDFEAAFTGDAEEQEFAWWQANTPEYLKAVEVYKASHHGSNNGDDEASMSVWQPEVVVIGVSSGNSFGHPTEQALDLYKAANATVYRTDQHGSVVVTADASGVYRVSTEKDDK